MLHSMAILDDYGNDLEDEDIRKIEDKLGKGTGFIDKLTPDMRYQNEDITMEYLNRSAEGEYIGQYNSVKHPTESFQVVHTEWRSQRKVYFLSFLDAYGEQQLDMVSEDFVIPNYAVKAKKVNEYGKTTTVWNFDGYSVEEA